tara:strand:- start:8541 stop:8792 length:252 start_codon:yes stop_codon:yes gene_type:complete
MKDLTIKKIKEVLTIYGCEDLEDETVIKYWKDSDDLYEKYYNKYNEYSKLFKWDERKYCENMIDLINKFRRELNCQKTERNLW